jgi:hypothetical protein
MTPTQERAIDILAGQGVNRKMASVYVRAVSYAAPQMPMAEVAVVAAKAIHEARLDQSAAARAAYRPNTKHCAKCGKPRRKGKLKCWWCRNGRTRADSLRFDEHGVICKANK